MSKLRPTIKNISMPFLKFELEAPSVVAWGVEGTMGVGVSIRRGLEVLFSGRHVDIVDGVVSQTKDLVLVGLRGMEDVSTGTMRTVESILWLEMRILLMR